MTDANATDDILVFAHIGDLHITDAKQRNFTDFLSIVAQLETECSKLLDFVVLPGDNADNGLQPQYRLIAAWLKMLSVPVHAITGDHDMEQGSLTAFHVGLNAAALPKREIIRGTRCLFVDMCGAGSGGPDFRLGESQIIWLKRELDTARERDQPTILFMHSYPEDLKDPEEKRLVNELIASNQVALVDMGHTHYNELANDGHTIFAATRSTGQIEEGPPGLSLVSYDRGAIGWRFKAIDEGFPFVLITSPGDHRLIRNPAHAVGGNCEVRAVICGHRKLVRVVCGADDQSAEMHSSDGRIWKAKLDMPASPLIPVTVRATDDSGRVGEHTILAADRSYPLPKREGTGSDAVSIGAWVENGIFGTQLGPNRNAKPFA